MFEKKDKRNCLHYALILAVSIIGIADAIYLGISVHNSSKENLLTRTNTISQFITAKEVGLLRGSEEDLNNPSYINLKNKLMSIRSVNPDMRFVYLTGMEDGKVFFYVDSEAADSSSYSPPGQQYDEASDLMKKMFQEKEDGFEITGDRWGMWASALVPIVDSENGKTVALLGIDVAAGKYIMDVLVYCLSALLFALLVILLMIGQRRAAMHMYLAEESLKANSREVMNLKEIIEEKEQKIEEMKKKIT